MSRRLQHEWRWMHRANLLNRGERLGGDVLKFERDDIHTECEATRGVEIVIARVYFVIGDLPGRRFGGRIERMHAIPHSPRRDGEHAAQLPAAEDADRLAGEDHSI